MLTKPGGRASWAITVWWVGVMIATTCLFGTVVRRGPVDLTMKTPFDNTGSGHAELWAFLRAATDHLPPSASFTVVAPDGETEMKLYMMAVGLLPEARPTPWSYYGQSVEPHDSIRFILEYGAHGDPQPGWRMVSPLPGGCLLERQYGNP